MDKAGARRVAADERLAAVVGLAQAMAAAQDRLEAARVAAGWARAAMSASTVSISVREGTGGKLRVLVDDPARALDGCPSSAAGEQHVVAPIVLDGRHWGELRVARKQGEPAFDRRDACFAAMLAELIAAGLGQIEQLAEARRMAFTDSLTGLANRRAVEAGLDDAIKRHRADNTVVSLVICDLNGLKKVNDELGHDAGDGLLKRFADLLSQIAGELPGSLAARLGGDEFCLLATGCAADEVARAMDRLCRRAEDMGPGNGVSVGMASTADPVGRVTSARRLFRLADAAQYQAKASQSRRPVVAGRGGAEDPVVRLVDAPEPAPSDRRRFRDVRL